MKLRGKVRKEVVLDGDLIMAQYWVYEILDLDMPPGRQVKLTGYPLDLVTGLPGSFLQRAALDQAARFLMWDKLTGLLIALAELRQSFMTVVRRIPDWVAERLDDVGRSLAEFAFPPADTDTYEPIDTDEYDQDIALVPVHPSTEYEEAANMRYVLGLVEEHFNIEGTYMVCKHCGEVVDWVTRHLAERHGLDVRVLPSVRGGDELW